MYPMEHKVPRSSTGYHGTINAPKAGKIGPCTSPRITRVAIKPYSSPEIQSTVWRSIRLKSEKKCQPYSTASGVSAVTNADSAIEIKSMIFGPFF